MRKDDQEVAALKEAAAAIDAVHARLPDLLCAGRTELEVGADIRVAMLAAGHVSADLVVVASGPNGAIPSRALGRAIRPGDAVVVDIGGTMPSATGPTRHAPTPSVSRRGSSSLSTQCCRSRRRRPVGGQTWGGGSGRRCCCKGGHKQRPATAPNFNHRTGHGIGLQLHEEPYLSAGNSEPLTAGMTFGVEPGIYMRRRYGARLEDIVVCTSGGCGAIQPAPSRPVIVEA